MLRQVTGTSAVRAVIPQRITAGLRARKLAIMIRRKVVRVYKIRCPSFSYHPPVFPFVLEGNEIARNC